MRALSLSLRWSSWKRRLGRLVSRERGVDDAAWISPDAGAGAGDGRGLLERAQAALDERSRNLDRATVRLEARRDAVARSEEVAYSTLEARLRQREVDLETRDEVLTTREGAVAARTRAVEMVAAEAAGNVETTRARLERELYVLALESRLAEAEQRASDSEAARERLTEELANARAMPK